MVTANAMEAESLTDC